ncbi:hypothetical protein ATE68_00180 [Sphingopyxis sp. H038]|uniref:asparagine synthase-related protein n=1 Tax=unclassified Sphingopyxis TaxID=2614943 RepID=UPI0007309AB2|nr:MULTISPECIES: asparagine synthetase B family protein [unclassified Sphingopyxis]KTE04124.1 hypothetical protein ATE78_00180 [Sphingopyxis sp. H012]KTE06030.1 hypothetical protein ATE70_23020 [Sphingopyxis sp. H053]KTE15639.1 hypothetical protein ATE76_02360 [Sphingopyxis sp. H093]KTE15890.1 hypothetical protein ATE76_03860 [Sphingopyxis sp. H093]KTE22348.1 hypothetical protein ATE75_20390 [Sphingopyxis sp. H080]
MALRYLVLASRGGKLDDGLVDAVGERTGLVTHWRSSRLAVLTSEQRSPLEIGDGAGTIIGDLFHRHGSGPAIRDFDAASRVGLAAAPVRELLERYWGGYLAVWTDGELVRALRDPSGQLPCCYAFGPRAVAFASDPRLLIDAGVVNVSIDWGGVATTLYVDDLAQIRTGLTGVSDLLAGNLATVDERGCSQAVCWSPWHHVSNPLEVDYSVHVERLRRAVEQCGRGWVATFDKSILAVSGGLDSSILASCVAGSPEVECFTLRTNEPRGDETIYAEELCKWCSLPLETRTYRLDRADIMQSAVAHLPKPGGRTQMVAYDETVIRQMAARSATAFFTGAGGDNVFYNTRSVRPIVDRYLAAPTVPGLLATLRDLAQVTEASIWEVARRAFSVPRRRGPKYSWPFDPQFLHPGWIGHLIREMPSHPWLEAPTDALPGKCGHVAMITRAQHYMHGHDRRLNFTEIAPLLSQPVVEAALAIPSWMACEGGVDRSAARRAFAPKLPSNIIRRRMKGGPDAFAMEILRSNYDLVRNRLLGGQLAANGIINKPELEVALAKDRMTHGTNYVRLLLLLDTESWIEAWQSSADQHNISARGSVAS